MSKGNVQHKGRQIQNVMGKQLADRSEIKDYSK